MHARLIATDGPYLEAKIAIDGIEYCVMDLFSLDDGRLPKAGACFECELWTETDDEEEWEDIFSGNPEHKTGLQALDGWRYRAYGKIIAIHPVVLDCGLLKVEDVVCTNDPRVIGEFIAVTISRLSCYSENEVI